MAKIRDLTLLSDILPTGFHGAVTAGVGPGSTVMLFYGRSQRFAAIQNVKPRLGEIEPAVHQIAQEFADHCGVLGRSLASNLTRNHLETDNGFARNELPRLSAATVRCRGGGTQRVG